MGTVFDPEGAMICIYLDNIFGWLGFAYGLLYSMLVVACGPRW